MPFESVSKGRHRSPSVNAGVLLKHMYMLIELSASTPPVIIISLLYSSNSLTAVFTAVRELAHAASTTQFIPPRFRRLAIRPDMTLPSMPGKELSTQGM